MAVGRALAVFSQSAVRGRSQAFAKLRGDIANLPGTNMPFQTKNKPRLLITMVAFLGFGFSLPFVAVLFQRSKSS
eukprot:m.306468 g.306468  ORF g.306468 m.306468 type:complete len:75 (+) comp41270_c0_seq1:29-253(+)